MPRSRDVQSIFTELVNRPAWDDPRTTTRDAILGFPNDYTCRGVVGRGLADFSRGFTHRTLGSLSADDLVLLYCYFNMKGHFDAATAVFGKFHREALFPPNKRTLIVDIGCGPGTACLALADIHRGQSFGYFGIDSAEPMQRKARAIWQGAQDRQLVSTDSKARFFGSWSEVNVGQLKSNVSAFLLFSYFFASHSLTGEAIDSLIRFVCTLRDCPKIAALTSIYINSNAPAATSKYTSFKRLLGIKSRAQELTPKSEYEVLLFKGIGW